MSIQIKLQTSKSLQDLIKKFGGFSDILVPELRKGLLAYAFKVERESKIETPVDTGRLRASIGISSSLADRGLTMVVGPNAVYSTWIHQGKRIDPRFGLVTLKGGGKAKTPVGGKPYMKIGAERSESFGSRAMKESVQSALNKLQS